MARYRSRSRSPSYRPPRGKHYDDPRDRHRRSRSPSHSYSPPRGKHYDDPRDRYRRRDERSPAPSGLLIRNIALNSRPEDLRIPFERFGPVKDVYLPRNYFTGEPRGFGFVKFRNPVDAAEAKEHMHHKILGGREISIVFAEENRKTPREMRSTRNSDRYMGGSSRRRSRSPRRRYHSYSRSPSPSRRNSRDRDRGRRHDDSYSPPRDGRYYRSRGRSPSPEENGRSPSISRSYGSDRRSSSPQRNGRSRNRSRSHSSH